MYSREDLEKLYFQHQTEAMPQGIFIEQFCSRNKVPYNIFCKWYTGTHNKTVEVKEDGLSFSVQELSKKEIRQLELPKNTSTSPVCILVEQCMINELMYLRRQHEIDSANI